MSTDFENDGSHTNLKSSLRFRWFSYMSRYGKLLRNNCAHGWNVLLCSQTNESNPLFSFLFVFLLGLSPSCLLPSCARFFFIELIVCPMNIVGKEMKRNGHRSNNLFAMNWKTSFECKWYLFTTSTSDF